MASACCVVLEVLAELRRARIGEPRRERGEHVASRSSCVGRARIAVRERDVAAARRARPTATCRRSRACIGSRLVVSVSNDDELGRVDRASQRRERGLVTHRFVVRSRGAGARRRRLRCRRHVAAAARGVARGALAIAPAASGDRRLADVAQPALEFEALVQRAQTLARRAAPSSELAGVDRQHRSRSSR